MGILANNAQAAPNPAAGGHEIAKATVFMVRAGPYCNLFYLYIGHLIVLINDFYNKTKVDDAPASR
ncbi:hypothetical protein ACRYJU_03060 [Alloalcanivorax xenomutans]|uniref:hypothetical protein n=1 Tax=Alloalcanivorax xenomutans TaxID=1094342 RepID=UPI0029315ACB|nr:hypothetical protein [Alloalcanivorax xenomutans]WOA32350.1 hypothetical protein RVY87_04555 [Alloalcanivorax xenomutans]